MTPRFAIAFALAAFALHLAWELAACAPFYIEKLFPLTWGGMLRVTAGDMLLTVAIYAVFALLVRDHGWGARRQSWSRLAGVIAIGAFLAAGIELHALATSRWAYSGRMPVLAFAGGVGLLPMLQLALLTPVSLWIARRSSIKEPCH